jgi:hypothetical protein
MKADREKAGVGKRQDAQKDKVQEQGNPKDSSRLNSPVPPAH